MSLTDTQWRERIERRLRGTEPQDTAIVSVPGWGDLDVARLRLRPRRLTPAAVLVPLVQQPGSLNLLLTRRAAHLKHHAGQISFPGGRIEPGDAGPLAAALRETEEEIGLPASAVRLLGYLDNYLTITGYSVTPVVGLVERLPALTLDTSEVDEVFEVPLAHVFDPARHERRKKAVLGMDLPYYAIPYERHTIWGATAAMIVGFYKNIMDNS